MEPPQKKRKPDETLTSLPPPPLLTKDDVLQIIAPLSRDQLAEIVASSALHPGPVLSSVRSLCGRDVSHRKLFVRGLGWETTHETLKSVFAAYGEIDEAVVISDKVTGKSKGYGFVTFRHLDGAVLALKNPSKKIDGRVAVTQLAGSGKDSGNGLSKDSGLKSSSDVAARKIFIGNVPSDMSSDQLLEEFATFGEIQEGPVGIDKQTGKFKGFALFVYKTAQGAQAALANPNKLLNGHWLVCKPGDEGKKGKNGTGTGTGNGKMDSGPAGLVTGSEMGNNGINFPSQYSGTGTGLHAYSGTGTGLQAYNGTGTGISSYPTGFSLPNNSINNTSNPNTNNINRNNGVGMGNLGPGSQYPGLAALNFGSGFSGNSNPGLFRMNQATGFSDPNQTQPSFGQPGISQLDLGQMCQPGLSQTGQMGQPALSQSMMGQAGLGRAMMGQVGMGHMGQRGQLGLGQIGQTGQGGRATGGIGFYPSNMQRPYY